MSSVLAGSLSERKEFERQELGTSWLPLLRNDVAWWFRIPLPDLKTVWVLANPFFLAE